MPKNFKICKKLKFPSSEKNIIHTTHLLIIVIICAKYKKNPSRTVDATERTWFSKSRLNDLEDIGQGQRSSHMTHPHLPLIICTKYGKNPSWTVDATGWTWKVNWQTDRQTDRRTDGQTDRQTDRQKERQTDRQTGWIQYNPPPPLPHCGGGGGVQLHWPST